MRFKIAISSLFALVLCGGLVTEAQTPPKRGFLEGQTPPSIAATAASGPWLERAPFDPSSYGKVRGMCPEGSAEPKLVVYTSVLSDDFFKVAAAADAYAASRPELAWSFVEVTDFKGAQRGGYTADELQARLSEIKTLAEQHGITHLSFFVAAPGSHDLDPKKTVRLVHLRLPETKKGFPVVDWVSERPIADLQGSAMADCLASLDARIHVK